MAEKRPFHVNVEGGTNAGWKRQPGPAEEWFCRCPSPFPDAKGTKLNARYLVRCPDCGEERP